MSMSDRDKKVLLVVIPVVFVVAYWFLLLAPKREEASKAGAEVAEQEKKRDEVTSKAARLESAKATFARDYRDVVRLGKAIPSTVDMPSLIVQLDQAARGTGIKFTRIKAGERAVAGAAEGGAASSGGSGDKAGTPASGGSEPAQSQSGSAAQSANNTANDASQKSNASSASGDNPTDTTTSSAGKSGGLPVGGGATAAGKGGAGAAPGLDSVPLEFKFDGSYFDLADFFHRLKRFVRVTNKDVLVRGRLMTIDGMKFATEENDFPSLTVEVKATVYLSPKTQGTTAGASPQGPATTQTAAASSEGSPAPSAPPTATATP